MSVNMGLNQFSEGIQQLRTMPHHEIFSKTFLFIIKYLRSNELVSLLLNRCSNLLTLQSTRVLDTEH